MTDAWIPSRSELNIEAEEAARSAGVDWRDELLNLRDWAKAEGKTYKDWDARWRTWIRRASTLARPQSMRSQNSMDAVLRIANGEDWPASS